MKNKYVVGLTGGIGSGKSAVSNRFAELGIDIVDADEIARDVVAAGSSGLSEIVKHFGPSILLENGSLNRPALRERVFYDKEEQAWLNALLHPLIRERMHQLIEQSQSDYCILSVPLLVENKLTVICDRVLVVDCPEALQIERATMRDGSATQTIKNIMAAQASRDDRLSAADDVIDNSGSLESLSPQIHALHALYLSKSTSHMR